VFGGPFSDAPHSIAATASGDVYVTGFFSSVANFGGSNLTSGGASDIFMAKYDASGSHQWSVRFGGTSFDQGRSIAADGSGNVLLGSDFRNTVNFGGSNLTIAGATDIALARFSDAAPNTQAGSNVQVSPIDATTSTTPVALTFSSVTTAGITSLTTGPSGPSTPGTFILGDGTYYNLSTTAGTTGDITVCITYNEAALTVPEGALRLLHWDTNLDPDAWVDLTTSLDTGTNVICGVTDHFSPFVIGAGSVTAVDNGMPAALALQQNVPNPFNPATVITYDVPQSGAHVTIRIYDTKGAAVRTLVHEQRPAGSHRVVWDGLNNSGVRVSSGVYFCRMTSGSFAQSRRMVLLK
jgi:hypothetical protein